MEDHAVIYTDQRPPDLLPGENVSKQPIRVISSSTQRLAPESRINFGKPYAVEHNCKVQEVGMVADKDIHLLTSYFQQAMNQ